jgi:hypothetical protein
MITLGNTIFGNYSVWITDPSNDPGAIPLYEVLLLKKDNNMTYYVDLVKEPEFKSILALNEKNQTTPESYKITMIDSGGETKVMYPEYESYLVRKSTTMPLWKLSKNSVEKLLGVLAALPAAKL